jgi:hypothetical protein
MYRTLQSDKIIDTTFVLAQRVAERFPSSGLSKVASELAEASKDLSRLAADLGKPLLPLRVFSVAVSLIFVALVAIALMSMRPSTQIVNVSDLAQGVESLINDVVFAGLAIWFLFTIESRIKRKRALDLIAQLRSLAHVIDMHQLTKDPDRLSKNYQGTSASPMIEMTPAMLTRYLDYCGEMLAILGKLAALLVQDFNDAQTLSAVNDIEDLTSGLQRKIWQKIMIIDRVFDAEMNRAERNQTDAVAPHT